MTGDASWNSFSMCDFPAGIGHGNRAGDSASWVRLPRRYRGDRGDVRTTRLNREKLSFFRERLASLAHVGKGYGPMRTARHEEDSVKISPETGYVPRRRQVCERANNSSRPVAC